MQSATDSLGTLNSFSTEVHLIREGQETILFQGDAIREGDILINKSGQPVEFDLPPRSPEQGLTKMILPAGASAALSTTLTEEGSPVTRISSEASDAIELIVQGEGTPVAEVTEEGSEGMAGLVGTGMLAGGGLASLLGGGAALVAGGALLDSGSDDNNNGSSGNSGTLGTGGGGSQLQSASDTNGAEGALAEVSEIVDGTPLEPVNGLVEPVQAAVGELADALESAGEADPTGITGVVAGVLNGGSGEAGSDDNSGLVGIVEEVVDGLASGTADTPIGTVTGPLTDALELPLNALGDALGQAGSALDPVAAQDPTGLTQLVQNALGDGGSSDGSGGLGGIGGLIPVPSQDSPDAESFNLGLQGTLDEVGTALDGTPLAPVNSVVDTVQDGLATVIDPLNLAALADPTGAAGLLTGALGSDVLNTVNGSDGSLISGVRDITDGIEAGVDNTPVSTLTDPLSSAIDLATIPLDDALSTIGDALDPVASADPTGTLGIVQTLLGSDGGGSGGGLPLIGELTSLGDGGLPLIGELTSLGDGGLPLIGELTSLGDGGLPAIGDLPLLGDALGSGLSSQALTDGSLLADNPLTGLLNA